ncbi:SusC/RagA family TonB-linked outer membrane protein [Bacteroides sp. OttesenSCG-928-J23]|nr:SusC/RagA family TonB-linked outer membrane protein [Bacteroides sp. OttesenSCG-928-N06]MDL2247742.1 SusC/RagA family TonB-linked outer membrane protein [Bacteroides sp. OttesenSCG-928-J23]
MGLLMSVQIFAQAEKIHVKGVIKDPLGETIIGANVHEKGQNNGTITDIDGNFSLNISSTGTLVVSFIGYTTQEIPVNGKTSFNIILSEDTQMIDEVVVVGYGTMRKKDLTGSIVQIRPDKLANESPKTVQDILRGTAGLHVGYDASAKGGGSMQLRGQRSVYEKGGHNDPLIVLDGMLFFGELSEINTDDIGQIDILKDASAAAVYGSRAASGVIVITTKKGKQGKPVVNVSVNAGITTKSAYRDVFGPSGYMQYRQDWYKAQTYGLNEATGKYEAYQTGSMKARPGYYDNPANIGKYGITLDQWRAYDDNTDGLNDTGLYGRRLELESAVLDNYIAGKTFDWADHTFRTGFNQDYNASISGAGEKMNYYLSLGYLRNEGAVSYDNYQAIRANMKVEGKVNRWLEIGANVNFQDRSDGNLQPGLGTDYWDANQLRNSPYSNYRNEDGSLAQYPMGADKKRGHNYDFERQFLELEKGYTVLNSIFTAKVKLPYNITYSFNASPRYQWFYDRYFMSADLPDSNPVSRGVNREQTKSFDWSLNNTIAWDYTFNDKHHVVLTLVQEAEERRSWRDKIESRNILPSDALGFHNTQNGTKENSSFSTYDSHQTADALLGRLFYSYDDRYMITAAVRRDGYSAFGQNNPYATFPTVALGWSFTNEKFFNWEPMSNGKLRVSWGKNGNRSLEDPYVSLADLNSGLGATMGYIVGSSMEEVKYLMAGRMANPNLQWEKTASWNFGLDFGFLNDRINGTLEYYTMNTTDMIMWQRLPIFTGFGNVITNLGEVTNKGFELTINSQNIKTRTFEWNTSFNISYNKNRVKHLYYEHENVLDAAGNVIGSKEMNDESNNWFIGKAISAIWNYRVTGIWQADEYEEAAKYGQKPGDPKVKNNPANDEYNEDGTLKKVVYNNDDKEFLGQTSPPVHWQLRNDFTLWNNLSVSFNIYSYMGHKSLSSNYLNQDNGGSLITYNHNTFAKKYWTPENPTNKYGRLNAQGPAGITGVQKLYNRSFIRLENISVGYTLPSEWTRKLDMEKVKIYGSIRNVATWKKDWEYGDPETSGLATRVFSLGLNVTF